VNRGERHVQKDMLHSAERDVVFSGGYDGWRASTVSATHQAECRKLLLLSFQRWRRRQGGASSLSRVASLSLSPPPAVPEHA